MSASSDVTPALYMQDTGGFELTDLGACSFLDEPKEASEPSSRWAIPEHSDGAGTSAHRTAVGSQDCTPLVVQSESQSALRRAAGAFARARKRGTSAGPVETSHRGAAPTEITDRSDAVATGSPTHSDRLDAALIDFLGEDQPMRSANEELELIYGGVFDPDAQARAMSEREKERLASGSYRAVGFEDDDGAFSWDDEALDAPIDPDDVRRRVGTRTDGVPQFAVLRRVNARTRTPEEE